MHRLGLLGAVLTALVVSGCSSSSDTGSQRLSLAPQAPPPSSDFLVIPGAPVYNESYMDPIDPADQQQNQGHGLAMTPDDPEYFAQFLRF